VLFPIFASYKALRTSDPACLAPWLMYFTVTSLSSLVETYLLWPISWLPFYAWVRLFAHLYLLLPGEVSGATFVYTTYMDPFLAEHEAQIERFISDTHDKARAAGWEYVQRAIDIAREKVLGMPPAPPPTTRRGQAGYASYAQSLLARFDLPSAAAARPAAGNLYGLVADTLAAATRAGGVATGAGSGGVPRDVIPPEVRDQDRANYIAQSMDGLRSLLAQFEREQATERVDELDRDYRGGVRRRADVPRTRSELEFEAIDPEEVRSRPPPGGTQAGGIRTASGGWIPFGWGSSAAPAPRDRRRDRYESESESESDDSRDRKWTSRSTANDLAY
jgi:receptor expression-enhancing protein 1/2/3/4